MQTNQLLAGLPKYVIYTSLINAYHQLCLEINDIQFICVKYSHKK